jgi:hypothetical protein
MRVTDNRYAAEMAKFHLAVRMIGHEARTGTIRSCTGFSEDRIRKIYATYFKSEPGLSVKRRRGKTPTQIGPFVSSSARQSEATVLACLFICCGILDVAAKAGVAKRTALDPLELGLGMCSAYETYRALHPHPELCFEKAWALFNALTHQHELYFAGCSDCHGTYIQDRYALDYQHCPFCDLKESV